MTTIQIPVPAYRGCCRRGGTADTGTHTDSWCSNETYIRVHPNSSELQHLWLRKHISLSCSRMLSTGSDSHTPARHPTRRPSCPWHVMSAVWAVIVRALHAAEVIWSSQFRPSEKERRTYPKHIQLWRCSDECRISTTHNAHTHKEPITPLHVEFKVSLTNTYGLLQKKKSDIGQGLSLGSRFFTTTSICQQTVSIIPFESRAWLSPAQCHMFPNSYNRQLTQTA